jgi:hypothetical protein
MVPEYGHESKNKTRKAPETKEGVNYGENERDQARKKDITSTEK